MAKLINNAGVQHYANKMVLAENRKVGSKSLPTALADIDNLIDEMKTQFDAEYGSALDMKLENNENVFSVGTGTNVDKSSEVENSFTDVELNGNSLVNLCPPIKSGMISFNTNSEGINTSGYYKGFKMSNLNIKIGQTYTSILLGTNNIRAHLWNNIGIQINGTFGKFIATEMVSDSYLHFYPEDGNLKESDLTNLKVILLEGDWTNKPIPQYFEGMKSVGQDDVNGHKIEILSSKYKANFFVNSQCLKMGSNNEGTGTSTLMTDESEKYYRAIPDKNRKVSLYSKLQKSEDFESGQEHIISVMVRSQKDAYINIYDNGNSSTTSNTTFVRANGWTTITTNSTNISKTDALILVSDVYDSYLDYKNFKLEKGSIASGWMPCIADESYSTWNLLNKKEISLNEPLRGLPNGVKDTIEKINGEWKIVRRCSEVVLNGSEPWALLTETDKEKTIGFRILNFLPLSRYGDKYKMVVCDRFPSYKHNLWKKDYEGITTENNIGDAINDTQLQIIISKSKLSSQDVAGFKQWLSENPTKVIYELVTPIIEDVSPVTLQCWKNGTISIDEILPVETTHTVALNKPAQIKRNIEELTVLRKRVQALEDFYDQVALEQSHQLSLINNSIELDYDI